MEPPKEIELNYAEVAKSGVAIGYGWDSREGIPKDAIAIKCKTGGPDNVYDMDSYCKEIVDVSTASEALKVSVEASYHLHLGN